VIRVAGIRVDRPVRNNSFSYRIFYSVLLSEKATLDEDFCRIAFVWRLLTKQSVFSLKAGCLSVETWRVYVH
jgi:hypothetical protein